MKSTAFLTLLATLFCVTFAVAQVPQSINYQAVIRTDSGLVVPNKSVNIRLSIQDGFTTPAIYSELHTITTNQFGLVTLSIGKGAATTGVFAQINWGIGDKFLKTEVDVARTSNYSVIGVQQFLSVPYALYAERAGNVSAANDGWKVAGNAATAGQFLGTTNAQDLKIFTNNLQRAIFSTTGNTGIGVSLPTAIFHTVGTVRHEGLATNNAASQIIVADASGNLALRDVSTLPTGGGGSGWLLTGNTATAANFIGTNNSQDLRFYTEGSQKMVVKTNGSVGIGTNSPTHRLRVETNSDISGGIDRIQAQFHNAANGSDAFSGIGLSSGTSGTNTWIEHIGANYSGYSFAYSDFSDLSYYHGTGSNGLFLLGSSSSSNAKIRFGLGLNNNAPVTLMTLTKTGLGIGTTNPTAQLHNFGTARFEGLSTNNTASQIIVADASGNLALRDVSTLPTGSGGGSGWLLSGNTATAANFIGTNNSQDLRFNTEGTQKMVVKTTGYVGIGTNTPDSRFAIEGTSGLTGADDRVFMTINNKSTTADAQVSLRLSAGNGTNGTYLGHLSPTYTSVSSFANFGQLSSNGNGLIVQAPSGILRFQTGIAPPSIGVYDRMTIINNGNVGIGTTAPTARFHSIGTARFEGLALNNSASQIIVADASGNLALRDVSTLPTGGGGGGSGWLLSGNTATSTNYIGTNNAQDLRFYTEGSQKMVVKTNGFVGIGTTAPQNKLHIEGEESGEGAVDGRVFFKLKNTSTGYASNVAQMLQAGNSGTFTIMNHHSSTYTVSANADDMGQVWSSGKGLILRASPATPSQDYQGSIRFYTGWNSSSTFASNERMRVEANGNVGIGTTTPDARLVVEGDGDGSGAIDERFLIKVNNKSTSSASQAIIQVTSGGGSNSLNISQSAPSYSISEKADAGVVYASGTGGLVLQASPKSSSDVDVSGIHFYTGWVSVPGGSVERMTLDKTGNLGIGTKTPKAKLEVTNGDVYVNDNTKGIILKSPNGGCWRVTVDNTGNFVRTSITCPQ
jgi:hypothetical protein